MRANASASPSVEVSVRPRKASAFYSDAFTATNGLLGGRWNSTNSAWAVVSNKVVCTPTLGVELFANIVFGADTDWTKGTGWAIAAGVAAKLVGTAANLTQAVGVIGGWFRVTYDITAISADGFSAFFGANGQLGNAYIALQSGILSINRVITSTALGLRATALTIGSIDNLSARRLTLSDLFASIPNLALSANISAAVTVITDTAAGLAGWIDSYTSPANFIICYHSGTNLIVDKCVGGTYTNLINATVAYSAGATILLKGNRSGADLLIDAFYNGSQVGAQQTVSDAGIISNTRHGLFSLDAGNTFDNFNVSAYA